MARHQLTLRSQEKPRLGWATPPKLGNGKGVVSARADGQAHWEMWWLLLNPHMAISEVGRPGELPKEAHPGQGSRAQEAPFLDSPNLTKRQTLTGCS